MKIVKATVKASVHIMVTPAAMPNCMKVKMSGIIVNARRNCRRYTMMCTTRDMNTVFPSTGFGKIIWLSEVSRSTVLKSVMSVIAIINKTYEWMMIMLITSECRIKISAPIKMLMKQYISSVNNNGFFCSFCCLRFHVAGLRRRSIITFVSAMMASFSILIVLPENKPNSFNIIFKRSLSMLSCLRC